MLSGCMQIHTSTQLVKQSKAEIHSVCLYRVTVCFPCLWLRFSSKISWHWSWSVKSNMVEVWKDEWSKPFSFILAEIRLLLFWLSLPFLSLSFVTALSLMLPLLRLLEAVASASSFSVQKHTHTQTHWNSNWVLKTLSKMCVSIYTFDLLTVLFGTIKLCEHDRNEWYCSLYFSLILSNNCFLN